MSETDKIVVPAEKPTANKKVKVELEVKVYT